MLLEGQILVYITWAVDSCALWYLNFQETGHAIEYFVASCAKSQIKVVLAVLFGYKAIIQVVGIVLAFLIRNVQVIKLVWSRIMM